MCVCCCHATNKNVLLLGTFLYYREKERETVVFNRLGYSQNPKTMNAKEGEEEEEEMNNNGIM